MSWYTAAELAGVHGLPNSERGIRKKATTESWESRPRISGKGVEYNSASLPAESQRALQISAGKKAAAAAPARPSADKSNDLNEYQRLRSHERAKVDAIVCVLAELGAFHQASGLTKGKAVAEFVKAWNDAEIEAPATVRELLPSFSRATLYHWIKAQKEQGIAGLVDTRGRHRRGTGTIDSQPDLAKYITGMMVAHPHIKATTLIKAIAAEFAGTDTELPSERRLAEWMAAWKNTNRQVFTAVTNPDAWKNKYMMAMGSASEHVIALNQQWEFDSTPADLMLKDGRYSILGVIDIYSRRTIFIVHPTSDSKGVAKVIRTALLTWGVPENAKTDNGSDYKSKYIQHVFRALDIQQEFCPPFQGWKKPHIERVFKTFSHDIAELLPGYIGHNVTERQAIESRKSFSDRLFKKDQVIEVGMTSDELQTFCNDWLQHEYHTRSHSELKCSPNQMVAQYAGSIRTISNERTLDVLLSEPGGTRTITKVGIKLNGGTYIHAELAAHSGQQVNVFYDEADIGRIYVYTTDGEYLCTAEDPSITGVSRQDVAERAKQIQKDAAQEERRRLKQAAAKVTKRDVAQQILSHRADQESANTVRTFPRPSIEHTSAGLVAAAEPQKPQNNLPAWFDKTAAAKELQSIAAGTQTSAPAEQKANVVKAEFNRGLNAPTGMAERYQFWADINLKMESGAATEEETKWARNFYGSAAWQSGKLLIEMRTGSTGQ